MIDDVGLKQTGAYMRLNIREVIDIVDVLDSVARDSAHLLKDLGGESFRAEGQ